MTTPAKDPSLGGAHLPDDKSGTSTQYVPDFTLQGSLTVQERFPLESQNGRGVPTHVRAQPGPLPHPFPHHHNLLFSGFTTEIKNITQMDERLMTELLVRGQVIIDSV